MLKGLNFPIQTHAKGDVKPLRLMKKLVPWGSQGEPSQEQRELSEV